MIGVDTPSLYATLFPVWNANAAGSYFDSAMQDRSLDDRHGWRTDLLLRLAGLCLLACCVMTVRALVTLHAQHPHLSSGPMALGLCGISFITGSLGSGLLMLGHHVFDTVEVGQRWAPPPPQSSRQDVSRAGLLHDDVPRLSDVYVGSRVSGLRTVIPSSFSNLWVIGQAAK